MYYVCVCMYISKKLKALLVSLRMKFVYLQIEIFRETKDIAYCIGE